MMVVRRSAPLLLAILLAATAPTGPVFAQEELSESQIEQIQESLNAAGYEAGTPDGLMGPSTRSAITAYQEAEGLDETGEPSRQLLERLSGTSDEPSTEAAGDPGDADGSSETGQQDGGEAAPAEREEELPSNAPDVGELVSETTGDCASDLGSLQSDLERVASQIRTDAISICEANTANYRILSQGAETLRRCRPNSGDQADEFAASAADAKEAVRRNCTE